MNLRVREREATTKKERKKGAILKDLLPFLRMGRKFWSSPPPPHEAVIPSLPPPHFSLFFFATFFLVGREGKFSLVDPRSMLPSQEENLLPWEDVVVGKEGRKKGGWWWLGSEGRGRGAKISCAFYVVRSVVQ